MDTNAIEEGRGVIVVVFREETSPERIREIVSEQGCRLQEGFDGLFTINVVIVPLGTDESMVEKFSDLPEVESVQLNELVAFDN